ncbi:hypothetical protein [Aeromonas veronii]|uniref:hypothetical protein n=1 Tax=Aeromonas veronii TaxID=654 RepID=UPI00111B7B45|nr:hypothetical protein [Aeromonas veronii]
MSVEFSSEKTNAYKIPMFGVNHNNFGMEWANSCVGDNGYIDNKQYYDGYIQASIKLMETILKSDEPTSFETQYLIDTLIYPICFSLRHSIEILLKRISETVIVISKERQRTEDISSIERNMSLHDIKLIWNELKGVAISNDERYKKPFCKIEPIVLEISDIDPTGQTFRYAYSTDSVKHLTDVGIISIALLYDNICQLQADMEELFELNDYIYNEYCLRSFTKNLSRLQLEVLAKELPNRSEWSEKLTAEYKKELREKFGISSNELTKAINLILSNYELSYYIGHEVPLRGISSEELFQFIDLWLKGEKVASCYNLHETERFTFNNMKDYFLINKNSLSFYNKEFVAGLYTLYYYSMENDGSEQYIYRYNLKINEYSLEETSWKMSYDIEHFLLTKPRLFDTLIRSMLSLKQTKLIEVLKERYGFLFSN